MANSNWRSSLGFASRLTAVTKIASAYQISNPALSAGEARLEATIAETKIYDEALSLDEYNRLCEDKATSLVPRQLNFPTEEDDEYVPTPGGRSIGSYDNALYHREGLFSTIYKAPAPDGTGYFPNESKSRVVALKVTNPSTMEPPHDSKREAEILKLASSDHVVAIFETFRTPDSHFVLVLPFMKYDMSSLLSDKRLSPEQIKRSLKELFLALAHIHSKDIIHRDIKPSNILLKSLDGPAYLSDFGIAWAPGVAGAEPANEKITDIGTTSYRPPEVLFGNKHYGCSLDLWAAGCTVAEALDPEHATLFDSGELGSDLALIQSMFKKLGTPNLNVWPEAAELPDWGKVQFHEYPPQEWAELLPALSVPQRELVSQLVRYESRARMSAEQILQQDYFTQ